MRSRHLLGFVVLATVLAAALVSVRSAMAQAYSSPTAQHKVIRVLYSGETLLMDGDPMSAALKNTALPMLLDQGWRIAGVHMTQATASGGTTMAALVVLEKK